MTNDVKQILSWVFTGVITLLLSVLAWNFNELSGSVKQLNATMTTIMIQNQDITRRVSTLEADNDANKIHWKEHDDFTRSFFETYDLKKKR